MLAKSRSDSLAKRAALSAPAVFLPRLLLCSTLPRASFLAMLDKLGRLGDATKDRDSLYNGLMYRSSFYERDTSRIGHRRDVAQMLLARLAAYVRLHKVLLQGVPSNISTTFLAWLTKECQSVRNTTIDTKLKKTSNARNELRMAPVTGTSLLSALRNDIDDSIKTMINTDEDTSFHRFRESTRIIETLPSVGKDITAYRTLILDYIKNGQCSFLNECLQCFAADTERMLLTSKISEMIDSTDLSVEILRSYYELKHPHHGLPEIILKWVPRLSCERGKASLWVLIFQYSQSSSNAYLTRRLLSNCLTSWSIQHIITCKEWILTLDHSESIDYEKLAMFLTLCSEQSTAQNDLISEFSYGTSKWIAKDFVLKGTLIAIKSLNQSPKHETKALRRRNCLPSGFTLVFLLTGSGKKQLRSICDLILREHSVLDTESPLRSSLEALFLRLYLNFPYWLDLGSVTARKVLMSASETFAFSWGSWLSSADDKIDDMLHVVANGDIQNMKQLSEMSRKQPLLLLRKLPRLVSILIADATNHGSGRPYQQGTIIGSDSLVQCSAVFHGETLKVIITHWGYTYNEQLWVAFLEVLLLMPQEVLFSSGLKVGLLDLFNVYVMLLSVQFDLLSANKRLRLRTKFDETLVAFRNCNSQGWSKWLISSIEDSQVRHLLLSAKIISTEAAINCSKENQSK